MTYRSDIEAQKRMLKLVINELSAADILITGIYMPSDENDAGIEISNKYVLQIAPYHSPHLIVDRIESPGKTLKTFSTTNELISWLIK